MNLRYLFKNRLFTFLHISGLTIGISACWIIFKIVYFEYSYEKGIPDLEHIYQIYSGDSDDPESQFAGVPLGMNYVFEQQTWDDAWVVPIYNQYFDRYLIEKKSEESGQNIQEYIDAHIHVIGTTENYFEMLPYIWLAGNKESAFTSPFQIVLTENIVKEHYPLESPQDLIGKIIQADTIQYTISGIVKNLDFPTHFTGNFFIPIPEKQRNDNNWHSMNSNNTLYVKTKNLNSLKSILELAQNEYDTIAKDDHASFGSTVIFRYHPLKDKHFTPGLNTDVAGKDKNIIYGLIFLAGFLLLLACINYINLSSSQIPQRAKEFGIKKTLGIRPEYLTFQFLAETAVIVSIACLLSFPLVKFFEHFYPEFIPDGLENFNISLITLLFLSGLILFVTCIAGIYPAYLINKLSVIDSLKGKSDKKISGTRLTFRKLLIIFQFTIAQIFIICALIIGKQLHYTLHMNPGYDFDAVITQRMPYKAHQNADVNPLLYKQALEKYPEIEGISMGHEPQSSNHWGQVYFLQSDTGIIQMSTPIKYVDKDFIDVYNIQLIAGRNLQQTDTLRDFIINETALKMLGFDEPEEALGRTLSNSRSGKKQYPIVGVVKDFNHKPIHVDIEPLILAVSNDRGTLGQFHIKLPKDKSKWDNTFSILEKEWKKFYPDAPFSYQFVDENIKKLYASENRMSKLINLASVVTIFISCLGLFGLANLTAYQKIKEIGIRKVLGASVTQIVNMLSKDFVKLVLIAFLVAVPVAWWAMNKWLENFAFKIDVEWWMFVFSGLIATVIALLTVSWQAIKAALSNPVDTLKDE